MTEKPICPIKMVSRVLGDRYEVQRQLGKNAGRQTLLTYDLKTQELVVVKLLTFGGDLEWDDLKLFDREAETLKALSHPAIPRYLNSFELDLPDCKGFALVQAYVDGKSLEQQLKAGRTFSETEVRQIAKALLEILTYLHGRQPSVIHHDIKPSNVLLTEHSQDNVGQVYLVDFGSVKTLTQSEGSTFTVVGTYGYMPPEQFGGRPVAASDLYGLGATLITLSTGTHPADLPQKNGRIQLKQATNLSPAFASWLMWMTEPNLDQRLASAPEALAALEQQRSRSSNSLVARKPSGSKVLLTKNVDMLEVLIPPAGLGRDGLLSVPVAIVWNLGITSAIGTILSAPFELSILPVLLILLLLWCAGLGMILMILFSVFGRVRLQLNQQISLTYELFGYKHNCPSSLLRQEINKLEYTRRSFSEGIDDKREVTEPMIIVWAGTQRYKLGDIGDSSLLSVPELDWLAHELSLWLELPITRE